MTRRRSKPVASAKVEEPITAPQPTELVHSLTSLQAMRIERNMAQKEALRHELQSRMARIEADDAALDEELAAQWGLKPEQLRKSRMEIDFAKLLVRITPLG